MQETEELFTALGLSQIISEPTNFEPNRNPSCIDLVLTDQPNLILASGTRASLDSYCHHQIIHCRVNFRIPSPRFERKNWHFIEDACPAFLGFNTSILILIQTGQQIRR